MYSIQHCAQPNLHLAHKVPVKSRPDLSSCCCLYSCNTDTTGNGRCSNVFALNAVSVTKRVNVKFKQK